MSLSQHSFDAVSDMFHSVSGIRLTAAKKPLVEGRLQKLARDRGLKDVEIYVRDLLKQQDRNEIVRVVDKLTTNETYFFREPAHFEFLDEVIKARRSRDLFRVWSGASSSGEEAYSIAMLLGDRLGSSGWEIIGTDLSTDMVATAQRGLYPMSRAKGVSPAYLKRFCLKGHGEYEGHLLISKELRKNVHFQPANLTQPLPDIGKFDVIFLRNVLIYFDNAGKADIVRRVLPLLKEGAYLLPGHAESLSNLDLELRPLRPAVYERL
jgi:chemotaxis protein methyltransferase CheR